MKVYHLCLCFMVATLALPLLANTEIVKPETKAKQAMRVKTDRERFGDEIAASIAKDAKKDVASKK